MMSIIILPAAFAVAILILGTSRSGRWAAKSPLLLLICGASVSLAYRAIEAPFASGEAISAIAHWLLCLLVFTAAAQLRVGRLAKEAPTAFRLSILGSALFLLVASISAWTLLPSISFAGALLLGAILMVNGAAFDQRAIMRIPVPRSIKSTVRIESAATIALSIPVAIFINAYATTAPSEQPTIAPLFVEALAALKAFAIGGSFGLGAALLGNRYHDGSQSHRRQRHIAAVSAVIAVLLTDWAGGNMMIAALGAGLVWGQQTRASSRARTGLRLFSENTVGPLAYFGFGCLFAPRFLQMDLLTVIFALSVVTILRVGPRLAALGTNHVERESKIFLAWFGGAPGAASILFLMTLLSNPAITDQDAIISAGSIAILAGVITARLTSQPLSRNFLRRYLLAQRQGRFASS